MNEKRNAFRKELRQLYVALLTAIETAATTADELDDGMAEAWCEADRREFTRRVERIDEKLHKAKAPATQHVNTFDASRPVAAKPLPEVCNNTIPTPAAPTPGQHGNGQLGAHPAAFDAPPATSGIVVAATRPTGIRPADTNVTSAKQHAPAVVAAVQAQMPDVSHLPEAARTKFIESWQRRHAAQAPVADVAPDASGLEL